MTSTKTDKKLIILWAVYTVLIAARLTQNVLELQSISRNVIGGLALAITLLILGIIRSRRGTTQWLNLPLDVWILLVYVGWVAIQYVPSVRLLLGLFRPGGYGDFNLSHVYYILYVVMLMVCLVAAWMTMQRHRNAMQWMMGCIILTATLPVVLGCVGIVQSYVQGYPLQATERLRYGMMWMSYLVQMGLLLRLMKVSEDVAAYRAKLNAADQ